MLSITALADGQQETLQCLGTLRPLDQGKTQPLVLKKNIQVGELGGYCKRLTTPLYGKKAMVQAAFEEAGWSFGPTSCVGVLCHSPKGSVEGYVQRVCGGHTFCLPIYRQEAVSPIFYSIAGYLPVEQGFVALVKRRVLLWSTLGLFAGLSFALSYLFFRYGAQGAVLELRRVAEALGLPL